MGPDDETDRQALLVDAQSDAVGSNIGRPGALACPDGQLLSIRGEVGSGPHDLALVVDVPRQHLHSRLLGETGYDSAM